MSFLSPLYALAALAIAVPILLHLVRKQPKQHQVFSSLMFLEATTPRLTSARRIDQWLLLLLRSAAILLLALAFSRPYWNVPAASESQRTGVLKMILLDTSASMRRTGVWEAAQQQANRIIDESNPTDLLSIYTFDDSLHPLWSVDDSLESGLAQQKDKARIALATAKPTWLQTDLGNALTSAADLLERDRDTLSDAARSVSQIVVVTDFQEGIALDKLADYTWPESIKVRIEKVDVKSFGNVRATVLSPDKFATSQQDSEKHDPDSTIASGLTVRVLVSNQVTSQVSDRSLNESFELAWLDTNQMPIESTRTACQVPANSRLTLRIPEPPKEATTLRIFGDEDDFDNQYFLTNEAPKETNLLCVDSLSQEPEESLSYFLKQLPLSSSKQMVTFHQRAPNSTAPWPDPITTPLIVASHLASEQDLQSLKNHIDRGGHVLWVWDASEENASVKYAEGVRLLNGPEVGQVTEGSLRKYAMLQQIDFQHPLFADLSDSKFNDYSKIRFWKHRSIELPSFQENANHWEVLSRFDDGSPAILTHTPKQNTAPITAPMALATGVTIPSDSTSKPEASDYGSGRIGGLWIMLAGWQPKESQLALSSKFVPLIAELYKLASPEPNNSQSMRVGDSIEWSMGTKISGPDGELLTNQLTSQSASNSRICTAKLDKPGVYTRYDQNEKPYLFSVNISESESLTAPAGLERLDQYGILVTDRPTNTPSPLASQQLRAGELESQQGWWRWLIVGVLAFVGFESLFCLGKGI